MIFRNLDILRDYGDVSQEIISKFENEFYIKLPKLYKDLIMKHNSPWCEQDCFEYYGLNNEITVSSFSFKGFETELSSSSLENIFAQYIYDDPVYGYEHVYSFGSSADGNFICFDYRGDPTGDEPKICIVIHDEYDEETGKHLLFPVADNFEEFLNGLKTFDEIMAKCEE
ncbi:SMI1/KNR4 family protein [Actinobacillus equuli]|uniref:SMI1/KNR4 family protein n=1 Tax=Actinobacillus equuli TaxID=718 RepID=UPI0024423709|nr:SMI1/KNR4 family protein [Actinobacillus equuli]WGE49731.1 SMI1/KNR4 family protein [Actinobacillus equuli subsp. equuli]